MFSTYNNNNIFSLGTGISVKEEDDWLSVGWPQVAVHHNYHIFQLKIF